MLGTHKAPKKRCSVRVVPAGIEIVTGRRPFQYSDAIQRPTGERKGTIMGIKFSKTNWRRNDRYNRYDRNSRFDRYRR
jgi:hypothetical protein